MTSSPDPLTGADAPGELERSALAWVAAWGDEVAAVELDRARARFSPDVVGFGTHAGVVHGLDALHRDQWSNVWPTIADFAFVVDEAVVLASPDGLQAVVVVPWTSTGFDAARRPFARPGRATVVLQRSSAGGDWLGTHTHFSLVPTTSAPTDAAP